ncbi:phage tail protein [Gilvibacter sediminis]|uniref:phage tail protein n=1 Tax=Gilvibacter sediminis TaxID=379071 RepID=UPI00234FD96C|nr:phage tail protein [Gilvibacter sediminis]MDC7996479.1 phage tail protein [Gilvibacter sediminis]
MPESNETPVGNYFSVRISGDAANEQNLFKEISGLYSELSFEEISEAGENGLVRRVPTNVKYSNLVVKRGLIKADGSLAKWCLNTMQLGLDGPTEPKPLTVNLLDEGGKPLITWQFIDAWPVKWSTGQMNANDKEIFVERIEFFYTYFEIK